MADEEDAWSYSDRDTLRRLSRPVAFNRKDDEAAIIACKQAIQTTKTLLLETSEAAIGTPPSTRAERSGDTILRLFYSSRIAEPKNPQQKQDDINNIVLISRRRNPEFGITGVLVANSKMYSQIIEGPSGSIKNIIGRISCDMRHQDIKIISRDASNSRLFSDWSMGLVLTELELEVKNGEHSADDNKEASAVLSFCSSIGIETI